MTGREYPQGRDVEALRRAMNDALTSTAPDAAPTWDMPARPTHDQVWQAWHGTTEPWGGCADSANVARVLALFAPSPVAALARAEAIPGARATDPATSHSAAASVSGTPTARNQLGRLLLAYLRVDRSAHEWTDDVASGMTSEEAARAAIPSLLGSEFSKRCSDLQALGYLRVAKDPAGHDRTRPGRSGRPRLVFELTDAGRTLAEGIEVRAL